MRKFQGQGTGDMGQMNLGKTDTEHVIPGDPESIPDIIEGRSALSLEIENTGTSTPLSDRFF